MKPTEFRCEKCDKLLARLTGELDSLYGDESTYICDGMKQHLEIKCSRCKHTNKRELVGAERVFGTKKVDNPAVYIHGLQIGKDTEALEAHNQVSRHGDKLRRTK